MSYLDLIQYGKDAVDDYVAIAEKQLAKMYLEAYRTADQELAAFMGRFGDLPEAQKYNRLAGLKNSIAKEYYRLTGKAIDTATKTGEASYLGAYESSWFGMEKSTGLGLNFGVPPVDAIRASVYSEVSGASFKVRFGKLYQTTTDKVAEAITRGLDTGQGYAKTAREVKDLWTGSYYNAVRVIRTESTRNFQEGNLLVYQRAEDAGIEGAMTWLSAFDGRVRPDHARMNGKSAGKDGYFNTPWGKSTGPGDGPADQVIACRCATYYKLKGFEEDYSPDWSYKEWKQEYGEWVKESPRVRTVS